ncbi:cell division protein ZapD [Legionella dresdenensis]|uniref:Cell division protein ZapD n=1 Tax=Legionella dresdenensis TaxID=450200 RepID=A0ABV8CBW8_9GAMM
MFSDTITFQLATHFLPRVALRVECLYQTINQACEETHPVIHHYALKNTIEIIQLIEKPELKSRFLKELMRIEHTLIRYNNSFDRELQESLHDQIHNLNQTVGRFGDKIHTIPFLQSIRVSQSLHNQDCEIHSPQLLLWLESDPIIRQRDLMLWLSYIQPLTTAVNLYLKLLRSTAEFDQIELVNGFYQRPIPSKTSCHLILLRMNKSSGIVPRMQLGHHGFSLRLCEANSMHEIRQAKASVDLAICQI